MIARALKVLRVFADNAESVCETDLTRPAEAALDSTLGSSPGSTCFSPSLQGSGITWRRIIVIAVENNCRARSSVKIESQVPCEAPALGSPPPISFRAQALLSRRRVLHAYCSSVSPNNLYL